MVAVQALRAGHPGVGPAGDGRRLKELGQRSFWEPPEDATPEQIAEFEAFAAKMLVPDETVTTWLDISGAPVDAKWAAIHEHVTQISDESPFMLLGLDGWRTGWSKEAYILRECAHPDLAAGDGPVRRDRLSLAGARLAITRAAAPSTPPKTWPMTTLPSPAGSRKLGCALSRMMCGRIRTWASSLPRNVSSRVIPSIVGSDQVWSKMKLPRAYQIGLPL